MLLENPQKASTSEPDQMGIGLHSLDSEPKPECMRNTSVTSCLQMMRPFQLIQEIPSLFIHNYKLEVVYEIVYLGSTITDNLSVDSELNK